MLHVFCDGERMCYRCNVTENMCVIAVMGQRTYVL